MDRCKSCGERSVILDPYTAYRVCSSCGVEQSSDNFQSPAFASDGLATGSYVRSVGDFTYRKGKILRAQNQISELTFRLDLSADRSADVSRMVDKLTEGEFGAGDWFRVLIAACAYITMRKNRLPLPIAEAASAVGRESHEVGRMVARVSRFLDLDQLPEFDVFRSLERTIGTSPSFDGVEKEKAEEMVRQGRFLLQCAVKWFLTTGRQPLPMVAAVAAFVAEVNGLVVGVEEIARDIYAGVATSKRRKKELVETLIKAAKKLLPWGEDVTVKNIVQNAPLLLRYMEMKSKTGSLDSETFGFDLKNMGNAYLFSEKNDFSYLDVGDREGCNGFKLSGEHLSRAYEKALEGFSSAKSSGEFGKSQGRKRKKVGIAFEVRMDRRSGKKKLTLDEILERDVGFEAPPPSFVAGLEERKRRRVKMDAAKRRIGEIMKPEIMKPPSTVISSAEEDGCPLGRSKARNQHGQEGGRGVIDWEDCIVERLLLHQANEEEIEQGHYNSLMDLLVFSGQ